MLEDMDHLVKFIQCCYFMLQHLVVGGILGSLRRKTDLLILLFKNVEASYGP